MTSVLSHSGTLQGGYGYGLAGYSTGDFIEDDKRACARETITFDNDIFNDLMS